MEAIIAWIIYLGLQFLELCNCFPVTPLTEGEGPPGLELGTVVPSLLAALAVVTAVLLLAGCSWCRRIIKKDVVVGQPIPLQNSGSSSAIVDTGIQNPLNDIRYPITAAIGHQSPPPRPLPQEEEEEEDNNNGPISAQELENIVNNNAENYIVSEYENRNLNLEANRPEVSEQPQTSRSVTPAHSSPRREIAIPDVLAEYQEWFQNPNEDFPRNQLQYLQVIGRGWFGRIVEGDAHHLICPSDNASGNVDSSPDGEIPPNSVTKVAVKILDENVTVTDKCTFLEESRLYRDLRHENLLQFAGRNLTQDPWLIMFEYCPIGDLKQFLLNNKSQMTTLTSKGLPLKFQCEISSALEYLHSHNLAHHDVACHSCLVAAGPVARLGDYGDADRRHPQDFSLHGGRPLPVRWLPPESRLQHQSTQESNMWSLGVFLWECCSWGELPYPELLDEHIISQVLQCNGVRLGLPVYSTEYITYLYNVMLSCWQDDPTQRCSSARVSNYLRSIYSNFHQHTEDSEILDFEARWQNLKPNNIPKVDNGLPAPVTEEYYDMKFPPSDISVPSDSPRVPREQQFVYHNLAVSSDTLTSDELSVKGKSDSLTNLHGSFESVLEKNSNMFDKLSNMDGVFLKANIESGSLWKPVEPSPSKSPLTVPDEASERLLFDSEVCQVAPWLRDVPYNTPEDISYIKNVSDVISDFDNMLSSEKTSSSESSHQTSPSRDVSNKPKSSLQIAIDLTTSNRSQTWEKLPIEFHDASKVDSISDLTKCSSDDSPSEGTLNDANIDSDIVNSPLHEVPEISNTDKEESYPTLDFRLAKMGEEVPDPMFHADCRENGQDFDSLQDSSYTPDPLKNKEHIKTESGDGEWSVPRQNSSGSETEDEIWKKRIEMGTITEKIKMKSKSVTDFMVLTHIDMDFTDLESEEASYTSMEGKGNMFFDVIQRKMKPESPPKETSLPAEQYLSFPRNLSASLLSRMENLRPGLDLYKLWRNHRNTAIKNLRRNKSLNNLTESQNKATSIKELQLFQKNMDSFLDINKPSSIGIVPDVNVAVLNTTKDDAFCQKLGNVFSKNSSDDPNISTKHFNLPANFNFHMPNNDSRMFPNSSLGFIGNSSDHLNVTSEEENLKFSSNFNDINLNLYANDHASKLDDLCDSTDTWESTKYVNPPDGFGFSVLDNSEPRISKPLMIDLYDSLSSLHTDANKIESNIESSISPDDFHSKIKSMTVSSSTPVLVSGKSVENEEIEICSPPVNNATVDDSGDRVDREIQDIMHNEILNLTTKLAIAENENNLNIEYSGPLEIEEIAAPTRNSSQDIVSDDHSVDEQIEVDDNQKIENNSIETNSLLTGSESGFQSQFDTMERPSIISQDNILQHNPELTDSGLTQKSDLEPTYDGSLSNDLESGIVSLDHSEKNEGSEESSLVRETVKTADLKPNSSAMSIDSALIDESIQCPKSNSLISNTQLVPNELSKCLPNTSENVESDLVVTDQANLDNLMSDPKSIDKEFNEQLAEPFDDKSYTELIGSNMPNANEIDGKNDKPHLNTTDDNSKEIEFKIQQVDCINQNVDKILLSSNSSELVDESINIAVIESTFDQESLAVEPINSLPNKEQAEASVELIETLDLEFQKLDAECEMDEYCSDDDSEPQYVNVGTSTQVQEGSSSGWFLHPKSEVHPGSTVSAGSSTESLTENSASERYTVDAESVEALRNELELKLPLAQRMGQIRHDEGAEHDKAWSDGISDQKMASEGPEVRRATAVDPEPGTSSAAGCSFSQTEDPKSPQQVRNQVLVHYSMYGVIPLSPIQEESWSEFSDMEKAADKTDNSNSLSLGEQTSNIENILPFDGVCQAVNTNVVTKLDERQHNWSDDDTHSDCSNRTFVLNEVAPGNLNRRRSLSADSLDSFDGEPMEFDDDNASSLIKKKPPTLLNQFPPHTLQSSELLSPFYDDHSHTKSTEEISQNVDNLLENISKTLENASKMTLSSESNDFLNQEIANEDINNESTNYINQENPPEDFLNLEKIDDISQNTSDADSGSKTYVIDDKKLTVKELSDVYNNQVAELPDDLSNVSKISQPSFISEMTSPVDSEIKPSDKSVSINLHTKTPSMDSWCSNDTLFNVEENFDDLYTNEPITSPVARDPFIETQTYVENTPPNFGERKFLHNVYEKCGKGNSSLQSFDHSPIEMVMGCVDGTHDRSLPVNEADIFIDFQHSSVKNSPDMPLKLPDLAIESAHLNSANKSDDSLTVESGISILANNEMKHSNSLDDVLKDSPISAIDTVLKLPTIHNDCNEVNISDEIPDVKQSDKTVDVLSSLNSEEQLKVIEGISSISQTSPITFNTLSFFKNEISSMDDQREIKSDSVDSLDTEAKAKPGMTLNRSAYVNTFEHLKTAMTSTPTSAVASMQKLNTDTSNPEVAESPDNMIDAQFQFLEGIVDSSISYISFKDDGSQNFISNERVSGNSDPLLSIDSISSQDLNVPIEVPLNYASLENIKETMKHSTGLGDIISPNFSVISSPNLLDSSDLITKNDIVNIQKNSTGLEDTGAKYITVIPSTNIDFDTQKSSDESGLVENKKHSTGSVDIGSPDFSTIPPTVNITKVDSSELECLQINKNSTGLESIGSPNFSIIPHTLNFEASSESKNISCEQEYVQNIQNDNTSLQGSSNFCILPENNSSIESGLVQNVHKNSTGLEDIGSPNFSMIPESDLCLDSHPVKENTSRIPIQSVKSNSTGLEDISSPDFSIIYPPVYNSTNAVTEPVPHSEGFESINDAEMSLSLNYENYLPDSAIPIRDWHVNNVTVNFLENERRFQDNCLTPKPSMFLLDDGLSETNKHNREISPTLDSFMENVAVVPQQINQDNAGIVLRNSPGFMNIRSSDFSKPHEDIDNQSECNANTDTYPNSLQYMNSSGLDEYVQYAGVNMGAHNMDRILAGNVKDSPSFETFKEDLNEPFKFQKRNSAELSEIQFSGPSNEDVMSTSFSEMSPQGVNELTKDSRVENMGHMAPERLKDWDSESDDSNCSSSSSGDFIWKEGGREQLLAVSTMSHHSPAKKQSMTTFDDIPEEGERGPWAGGEGEGGGEEDEEEEEEEEVEFVPSSWDCRATPTKSALKSPETSQMQDNRKRVVFKKQKYQCIYEYPREILSNEDDDLQALPDYSTYSDWHPFGSGNGSYMAVDFENFLNSHPGDLHQPNSDLLSEDDFYISSSTRPFETYNLISSSSQFFPGQHLSLFNQGKPYSSEVSETDEYDSLPTIPTEYEYQQSRLHSDSDTNSLHNITKPSFDYITPDSGTEDITPGSVIDYDYKDPFTNKEPFLKNNISDSNQINTDKKGDVNSHSLTEKEIILNSSNKNGGFSRPFCETLILPERGSSSGSLSPPSPSPPPALGGLRHTRDKLKLDLPPSPLARNSPAVLTSGKNANKDIKIFNFKNVEPLQSDDLDKTLSESASDLSSANTLVENKDFLKGSNLSLSEKLNPDSTPLEDMFIDPKDESIPEYDNTKAGKLSPFSPISIIGNLIPDKSVWNDSKQPEGQSLQKGGGVGVERKASVEAVKGEGTLLDSGDEDSGIGSSAYATLERKDEPAPNSNERQVD